MSAAYVANMEDVLGQYAQPYDPAYPEVCVDESNKELFESIQPALPMQAGKPMRQDCEYQRNGMRNLFVAVEAKRGWRYVQVTERRTAIDFAHFIKYLVDEVYPDAIEIQLVVDNLNTHGLASLYKAFEPAEAYRLAQKLRFHYTPKHGSWLNKAEIEIGIFKRLALSGRVGSVECLKQQVAALEAERNAQAATINWQFSCEQARVTLHRLYPKLAAEAAPVV